MTGGAKQVLSIYVSGTIETRGLFFVLQQKGVIDKQHKMDQHTQRGEPTETQNEGKGRKKQQSVTFVVSLCGFHRGVLLGGERERNETRNEKKKRTRTWKK